MHKITNPHFVFSFDSTHVYGNRWEYKTVMIRNDHNTIWSLNKVFWEKGCTNKNRGVLRSKNERKRFQFIIPHWNNTQTQVTRYIVTKSMILILIVCAHEDMCIFFLCFPILSRDTLTHVSACARTRTHTHTRAIIFIFTFIYVFYRSMTSRSLGKQP